MSTIDAPAGPGARHDGLDVLRGVAVLMIFAVNVRAMLFPFTAQTDPAVFPGPHDRRLDLALQYLIDGKWIAVFALLFGAGLTLIHDRAVATGADPRARIVRRQGWLLVFGLAHLYFVWLGDVLATYAVVGLVAMVFLEQRGRTIALWSAGLLIVGAAFFTLTGQAMSAMTPEALVVPGGDASDPFGTGALMAEEVAAKRGGYRDVLAWRAGAAGTQLLNTFFVGPFVLSYMLVGMVLLRLGFLTGRWRARSYLLLGLPLLSLAWSVDLWRTTSMGSWSGEGTDGVYFVALFRFMGISFAEGLAGGVGYAALVMAMVRAGIAPRALAAVGRTALTSYVACSVIGTSVAYGYGAGLIGRATLVQSMGLVALVWALLLIGAPLWLSAFRHGPLEWLWRSLTYGRPQPLRIRS